MSKSRLKILDLTPSQVQSGSFTLVLGEENGRKRVPIVIGMFEAQAIALELEKISPSRPLTHDLFKTIANSFDFSIEEVVLTDLSEGVFYAKLICTDGIRQKNIDARPSDAIAIALRFDAPIYANQKVLEEGGIDPDDITESKPTKGEGKSIKVKVQRKPKNRTLEDYSIKELNKFLDESLAKEDYEQAAKIRDEIERRN